MIRKESSAMKQESVIAVRTDHRKVMAVLISVGVLMITPRLRAGGEWWVENVTVTGGVTQTNATGTNVFMGYVGIGTNAPSAALHVVGNVTIQGMLDMRSHRIANVGAPEHESDVATNAYVEQNAGSGNVSTFTNNTYDAGTTQTMDSLVANQIVLVGTDEVIRALTAADVELWNNPEYMLVGADLNVASRALWQWHTRLLARRYAGG